ncbi:MAG: PD40 domain-containing protein [Alphaproteobacteria bacterium]|nr:PD40 domain-containing protein [Rickettsiales bacterium]
MVFQVAREIINIYLNKFQRVLLFCFLFLLPNWSYGVIVIDVHTKSASPVRIGVITRSESIHEKKLEYFTNKIASDLKSIRIFNVHEEKNGNFDGHELLFNDGSESIFLSSLKKDGLEYFLLANPEWKEGNLFSVSIKLWNVKNKKLLFNGSLSIENSSLKQIAHSVADSVVLELFGYKEYFNSRILHIVHFKDQKGDRSKRLAIMDRDGSNLMYINDFNTVMTPTYSNKRKEMFYVTYANGDARVKMLNITNGKITDLSDIIPEIKGKQILSPQVSKDGTKILFAMSNNCNTNIYLYTSTGKKRVLRQVTNGGINVSPFFSPNGEEFIYGSDIGGRNAIYMLSIYGGRPRKVSNLNGSYFEPKWSPDGKKILFTKSVKGRFYIGIMDNDGKNENILFSSYITESPSWSPNGRALIFSYARSPSEKRGLKIIDIEGREILELHGDANLLDPFWFILQND